MAVKGSKPRYEIEADKRWAQSNKNTKQRANKKSAARCFLRDDAKLEELHEFEQIIKERKEILSAHKNNET